MTLYFFAFIMTLVCVFGFLNEKVTKLTHEIALMLFSTGVGIILLVSASLLRGTTFSDTLANVQITNIEGFLMEGVLCFMLFAGSCHMSLRQFFKKARQISVLAFVCTFLGAVFYGAIFYGVSALLGLGLSVPICLMFGSIIAPTDPIAATSILKKFGLPKDTSFLIEGESLFNDGVGVALFVCFSALVSADGAGSFAVIMLREIIGAVLVGAAATLACFPMYLKTKSSTLGIFTSLLCVSVSYCICERFGFSGAIASVVCGITFSALREKLDTDAEPEKTKSFDGFWETLDALMNSMLYVMLGISFVRIISMEYVILVSLFAIAANLVSRSASLSISTLLMGRLPDNYSRFGFAALLTWGGLRGGLSVALAMSTRELLPDNIYFIVLGGTYAVVFFTTVIQGLTMKKVYGVISDSQDKKKPGIKTKSRKTS